MNPSSSLLSSGDRIAMLDAVQRFASTELAALTARPEQPMSRAQMQQALGQLVNLGLLNTQAEPACGLWDDPADASLRRFGVEALALLAQASPAVAHQMHSMALGARLDRLHAQTGEHSVVLLDGRWGVGRQALARALGGAALTSEESAWLADCWAAPQAGTPRVLVAQADWQAVWWPQWTPAEGWHWCRSARGSLHVSSESHQHGLDELSLQRISLVDPTSALRCADANGARFVEAAVLHGLGLLAMALGTTQRAIARARAFAQLRRQGGKLIAQHAAVQQLLAEAEHAAWAAQAALTTLQAQPPSLPALHAVWRARARLHPQLCDATSNALQVFGGIGYMRDTGAEKDLRDANTLRQLGGSPTELTLCCAALDELLGAPRSEVTV